MEKNRLKLEVCASGMLKKLSWLSMAVLVAILVFHPHTTLAQQQEERSGTWPNHERLLKIDPRYGENLAQLEQFTTEYVGMLRARGPSAMRSGVVRIPVVVYVIYPAATENISDAQIHSQIDVMNEDYRRLNADISSVPAVFQPFTGDARIEFALAVRDPDCNPTTGITRTSTTRTGFLSDDSMKSSSTGGHDAWPRDKYLNLWVCNLTDYLGYAQFPGGAASTDGVVVRHSAFGDTGTAATPFHLGRTATHELGHWFNVRHIWGDDGTLCTGSDFVADTPNQSGYNSGCPTFPHVSCSNGPDGDMFMNFMDYVVDDCMIMFTQGQVERMEACLMGTKNAILGSDGLIPPPVSPGTDLWSQDRPDDIGDEPNTTSHPMYLSDDIWIRRTNDGLTNQEHQNPEYRPTGPPNYVYVRIRNKGCGGSGSGTVKMYWAKASSGLAWSAPWDGSVTTPALMGGSIGTQATGSVAGGSFVILEFAWSPPNPADYASFGADQTHFCLLSRIETSSTSPYGMTFAEGANLNTNVGNNNNIVWKNVSVVPATAPRMGSMIVANFTKELVLIKLVFDVPRGEEPVFNWGTVRVDLGELLFKKWEEGGRVGQGLELVGGRLLQVVKAEAWIGGITLKPAEFHTIRAEFRRFQQGARRNNVYKLLLTQYAFELDAYREIGGVTFILKEKYIPGVEVLTLQDNAVMLTWPSFGGGNYTVEFSDTLRQGGKWAPVPGNEWPTKGTEWFEKDTQQFRQRYYRVRAE